MNGFEEMGRSGFLARLGRGFRDPYVVLTIVLIALMLLSYTFAYYHEHMPYSSTGYDSYSHLGLLRSVEDRMGLGEDLTPGMFPDEYRGNNRAGFNYVILALLASLPGSSNLFAMYLFGLLGIVLFLGGIFYLARTLSGSTRVAFLAVLLSLLLCGFDTLVHGNSFSWVELLIDAQYASTQAMGLMMIGLALNIRFLEKGGWRSYLLQLLLALLAFNIHILTGMQYFMVLLILVAVYALKERRLGGRHLALLSLIPAVLLLASLWPLYRWWSIFERNVASIGGRDGKVTSVIPFLEAIVLYLIGIPFLIRAERERIFLLAWALVFAIIGLSYLLPVSVAYYWRFVYVMRIPLVIGLALGLGTDLWRLTRWRMVAIPVILLAALSFIGVSVWRSVLRCEEALEKDNYAVMEPFVEFGQSGESLVALPAPGYNMMGLSSYNVISVLGGHAPREIVEDRNEMLYRLYDTPVADVWRELLAEYGAREVMVPNIFSARDVILLLNGVLMRRNAFYELYDVDPERMDTEVLAATPDPELEESSVEYGYTRLDHWAELQLTGLKEVVLEAEEGEGASAGSYLRATSDDPTGQLILLNRGFIEVDPSRRYTIRTVSRETAGDPTSFMTIYQYGSTSPSSPISIYSIEYMERSDSWTEREFTIGPVLEEGVDLAFSVDARYVKVGMILCYESTGQVEVDLIEIVPES